MGKREEFKSKVSKVKIALILIVGVILGVSCIFSKQIESFLGIGDKSGSYVASEMIANSDLSIHYIDVEQGDSTLICLPDDKVMLIDAGKPAMAQRIVDYIQALEITTIDYFIMTHSDDDHTGGAEAVFNNFEVKNVYRPFQIAVGSNGQPTEYEMLSTYASIAELDCNKATEDAYEAFIRCAYTEVGATVYCSYDGLTIENVSAGYKFEFFAPIVVDGYDAFDYSATKTIGYPTKSYDEHSDNNASPVILFEHQTSSFLFTGDAGFDVEEDLLASLSNDEKERFKNIDVFQAGHHGSNTSNSKELLELITPTYTVASCKKSAYGHPGKYFVERLNDIPHSVNDYLLVTEEIGNIIFGFTEDGKLAYTALEAGAIQGTIYWWRIAVGAFVVITIIILSVKVTTNKKATAKRVVSTTKRVTKKIKSK